MNNETRLPKFWKEIDEVEFTKLFFTYDFKDVKKEPILLDHNGEELVHPYVFLALWEIEYPAFEGLGIALAWMRENRVHYFKFGSSEKWNSEDGILISQYLSNKR